MQLTQAILPVAGLGTRFLPWTKVVPKELLPLGNQPIIAHLVDEALSIGIKRICFVISRGKEAIPQYFYKDAALEAELEKRGKSHYLEQMKRYDEVQFHVVYQDEQLGDGHALLQAADWVESASVAVLFGDDLFMGPKSGLMQLKSAARLTKADHGAFVALENIPAEHTHKYGIVTVDHIHPKDKRVLKLKGMVEKPHPSKAPSTLGIVGRYLIPKSIFTTLEKLGKNAKGKAGGAKEIRLIDALIHDLPKMPIHGVHCEGVRLDTGTPEGYREAVKIFE
ncbi:MAG: UTP--glucose-1-phosphate uridylyltransferase [Candidatus Peregrinibacteria bacterium Greene1014_49]|nr:MAG: UTP--glucose-1-phosphate uridylyltransferase [Candidatus Peregrinibacteria bacterium Greene1014_49]